MLEIFSRDRDIDFEFFIFTDDEIKYETKNYSEVSSYEKDLYRSLKKGTIIINGTPINIESISKKQIIYIKNIIDLFKEKVEIYKNNYTPVFINCDSGNDITDIIINNSNIEIPNRKQFKEWVHIKGFSYLEHFYNEYEKQNITTFKVKRKVRNFFKNKKR